MKSLHQITWHMFSLYLLFNPVGCLLYVYKIEIYSNILFNVCFSFISTEFRKGLKTKSESQNNCLQASDQNQSKADTQVLDHLLVCEFVGDHE